MLALVAVTIVTPVVVADFQVDFDIGKLNLGPWKTVRSSWGDPLTGAKYRAQLLYAAAGVYPIQWRAAGASAPFGAPVEVAPGTWKGGVRTLVGIEDGEPAVLSVIVWDRTWGAGWSQAYPERSGWSEAFQIIHSRGSTDPALMTNFPGVWMKGGDCSLLPPPNGGDVFCEENGSIVLLPERRSINSPGDFSIWLLGEAVATMPIGLQLGRIVPLEFGAAYVAKSNSYGDDWAYQWRQGGFCDPPRFTSTLLHIHVRPSPLRPYLVASHDNAAITIKLRGLAGREYAILKSQDLRNWISAGIVLGNYSEVDLSHFLNGSGNTAFYQMRESTASTVGTKP